MLKCTSNGRITTILSLPQCGEAQKSYIFNSNVVILGWQAGVSMYIDIPAWTSMALLQVKCVIHIIEWRHMTVMGVSNRRRQFNYLFTSWRLNLKKTLKPHSTGRLWGTHCSLKVRNVGSVSCHNITSQRASTVTFLICWLEQGTEQTVEFSGTMMLRWSNCNVDRFILIIMTSS